MHTKLIAVMTCALFGCSTVLAERNSIQDELPEYAAIDLQGGYALDVSQWGISIVDFSVRYQLGTRPGGSFIAPGLSENSTGRTRR